MNLKNKKNYPRIILTLLHSERPKLYTILAILSAIGLQSYLICYAGFLSVTTQVDYVESAQNAVHLKMIPRIDYTRARGLFRTNQSVSSI